MPDDSITFVFLSEGSSDTALLDLLEDACLDCGAPSVVGKPARLDRLRNPPGKSVSEQVIAASQLFPEADFFIVHRDADGPDATARIDEIAVASEDAQLPLVPLVPIQETEAWGLLDEVRIRRAAGNPNGSEPLDLPEASQVESVADPKGKLDEALIVASELSGRRLQRFKRDLATMRLRVLEAIDIDGDIGQLEAWRGFLQVLYDHLGQSRS